MVVGDSFFVPTGPFTKSQDAAWARVKSSAAIFRKKANQPDIHFEVRMVTESGKHGVRIWRVLNRAYKGRAATLDGRGVDAGKVPASALDVLDRALAK
jgi:hypothetical protein|tara:strand:+ start:15407 stop:15700 length:294 start_codon:yes stop_codon:yes gene_type:complete